MPSWDEVVGQFQAQPADQRQGWLSEQIRSNLAVISGMRGDKNCILFSSAFLQKPNLPGYLLGLAHEDLNGLMTALHGLDCGKGLTLILHSPGGDIGAAQAVMSYLHQKFDFIESIVPTYAMSAATMMALGSHAVIMGKPSQLGPIDAQMNVGMRPVSAGAVLSQFRFAEEAILGDVRKAHVWAPILQTMGPELHQAAKYALEYGESLVKDWLRLRMCAGRANPEEEANRIAAYFNTTDEHKHHGRRIDSHEARQVGVEVVDLEPDQALQEAVLTAYHFMTLFFEVSAATKLVMNQTGRFWTKTFQPVQPVMR
jgi:hypothetical protein